MSLFNKIIGKIEPESPFSSQGQSQRIDGINAKRAEGAITQEQFEDLMKDESVTSGSIRLKRMAAFILFAGIGAALLFS